MNKGLGEFCLEKDELRKGVRRDGLEMFTSLILKSCPWFFDNCGLKTRNYELIKNREGNAVGGIP